MQQMSFIRIEQRSEPYRPQVRDLPARERPLSRLRDAGAPALSTAELLACMLQTADALNQAQELLVRFDGLPGLDRASEEEITQVPGVGPAAAARIKAGLEFARRLSVSAADNRELVRSPSDIAALLLPGMAYLEREHFVVVSLDTRNRVLGKQTLYIGSLNAAHVRVAEVFQGPIRRNAAAVVVAHNHPSGDPSPSPEDVVLTRQLVEAGRLLDVEVLDHLVIGAGRFVSMRERRLGFE